MPRNVLNLRIPLCFLSIFGCKSYPIFGQWWHGLSFTPRGEMPDDAVSKCWSWTLDCICWVVAEDLTGEQASCFVAANQGIRLNAQISLSELTWFLQLDLHWASPRLPWEVLGICGPFVLENILMSFERFLSEPACSSQLGLHWASL